MFSIVSDVQLWCSVFRDRKTGENEEKKGER
jgi:hypothetical protein